MPIEPHRLEARDRPPYRVGITAHEAERPQRERLDVRPRPCELGRLRFDPLVLAKYEQGVQVRRRVAADRREHSRVQRIDQTAERAAVVTGQREPEVAHLVMRLEAFEPVGVGLSLETLHLIARDTDVRRRAVEQGSGVRGTRRRLVGLDHLLDRRRQLADRLPVPGPGFDVDPDRDAVYPMVR